MEGWQSLEIHQAVFGRILLLYTRYLLRIVVVEYIHDRYLLSWVSYGAKRVHCMSLGANIGGLCSLSRKLTDPQ